MESPEDDDEEDEEEVVVVEVDVDVDVELASPPAATDATVADEAFVCEFRLLMRRFSSFLRFFLSALSALRRNSETLSTRDAIASDSGVPV